MANWPDDSPMGVPVVPGLRHVNGDRAPRRHSLPGASAMYLRHIRNVHVAVLVVAALGVLALAVIAVDVSRVAGLLP